MMAARGWARLILDRRRDLINDRPSRVAAAEAPLDGAQERHHFDNPTSHSRGAFYHGEDLVDARDPRSRVHAERFQEAV